MKNIIIHIPHASLNIPSEYLDSFDKSRLQHELEVMTDWYCDELFDADHTILKAEVSRLVCDLERFRNDEDEIMSKLGMGAVYTSTSDMTRLRSVSDNEKKQILERYYDTHHRELTRLVDDAIDKYGSCLIIDGHSFYQTPLPYEFDRSEDRPDFCIGTSSYHTPQEIIDYLMNTLTSAGYSVKIDSPFAGTITPLKHYERDRRIKSVMIEINRKLYMSADGVKSSEFNKIKGIISKCIQGLEGIMNTNGK